ncbi:COX3 oxidase, partial [Acromyrmex heyeri]
RDVLREAIYQGCHSTYVFNGIKIGIILFIISENFFLFSFSDPLKKKKSLLITIILRIYFFLQLIEYINSPFTMADSIYGSTLFIATGDRLYNIHFSSYNHFGFEAAS